MAAVCGMQDVVRSGFAGKALASLCDEIDWQTDQVLVGSAHNTCVHAVCNLQVHLCVLSTKLFIALMLDRKNLMMFLSTVSVVLDLLVLFPLLLLLLLLLLLVLLLLVVVLLLLVPALLLLLRTKPPLALLAPLSGGLVSATAAAAAAAAASASCSSSSLGCSMFAMMLLQSSSSATDQPALPTKPAWALHNTHQVSCQYIHAHPSRQRL
jgi:hypothetical protein